MSDEKSRRTPPPTRISTLLGSHKKTMQRSSSAPSISQKAAAAAAALDPNDDQKKRNRTTPDQLQILEDVFARNPTPNSQLRDAIANKVGMSSRSVQVWFQNRRAKEKKIVLFRPEDQAKSLQMYLPQDPIYNPQSKPYNITQRMSAPAGMLGAEAAAFGFSTFGAAIPMSGNHDANIKLGNESTNSIPIEKLKIGTWTRIAMSDNDLLCDIDATTAAISWIVVEGPYRCKIEFPYSAVSHIECNVLDGGFTFVYFHITAIPKFYLEVRASQDRTIWKGCNDITEAKQASTNLKHNVQMSTSIFKEELLPVLNQDPILSKFVTVKDDSKNDGSSFALKDFEQKLERTLAEEMIITSTPIEEEKSMKKSQSVPTLPLNINPNSGFYDAHDTSYLSYLEPVVETDESWSQQSELGSFSQLDFDTMSSTSGYFSLNNASFNTPFLEEEGLLNN